jgi:hypothetical protein
MPYCLCLANFTPCTFRIARTQRPFVPSRRIGSPIDSKKRKALKEHSECAKALTEFLEGGRIGPDDVNGGELETPSFQTQVQSILWPLPYYVSNRRLVRFAERFGIIRSVLIDVGRKLLGSYNNLECLPCSWIDRSCLFIPMAFLCPLDSSNPGMDIVGSWDDIGGCVHPPT